MHSTVHILYYVHAQYHSFLQIMHINTHIFVRAFLSEIHTASQLTCIATKQLASANLTFINRSLHIVLATVNESSQTTLKPTQIGSRDAHHLGTRE